MRTQDQGQIAPQFLDAYQTLAQSSGGGKVIIEAGGQRREFDASPEIIQGLTQGVSGAAFSHLGGDDVSMSGRVYEDKLTDLGLTPDDVSTLVAKQDDGGQRWFAGHDLMGILAQRRENAAVA